MKQPVTIRDTLALAPRTAHAFWVAIPHDLDVGELCDSPTDAEPEGNEQHNATCLVVPMHTTKDFIQMLRVSSSENGVRCLGLFNAI